MQYFDPPVIADEILRKAKISYVELVSLEPRVDSKPLHCLGNVQKYIAQNGGEVQLGWIFSIMGNLALKLTAHAVVKLKDGSLLCVTPNEYRADKLKFAPDNAIEKLILNNHLPMRFVPLVENKSLDEYLDLERELDNLRLDNSGIVAANKIQQIQLKASFMYPSILELAKIHTSKNDFCFCGSGRKRKNCCR